MRPSALLADKFPFLPCSSDLHLGHVAKQYTDERRILLDNVGQGMLGEGGVVRIGVHCGVTMGRAASI